MMLIVSFSRNVPLSRDHASVSELISPDFET
jgi:hypothetical protein